MPYCDTHCHLVSEKFDHDLVDVLDRAKSADVELMLNIAYCPITIKKAIVQGSQHKNLFCALGIQPHDAQTFYPALLDELKLHFESLPKAMAVGEIGLDAYYKLSPMDVQIEVFKQMLDLAIEVNRPVVVHVRETHQEVLQALSVFSKQGGRGVIHCFTGTKKEAFEFLDIGFKISFSGIVTFKNALELQETSKQIPLSEMLIETDSPYLAPMPNRGKRNEPSFVPLVAKYLSQIRGEALDEFAQQVLKNSIDLFQFYKE